MSRLPLSRIAALAALAVAAGVPAVMVAGAPASAATAAYTITDLGSLGGGVTEGLAINATGQVTGYSDLSKQVQVPCEFPQSSNQKTCTVNLEHAFLWSNGTMTDLGTLAGDNGNSQGVAINDSGQVVGSSDTKTGSSSFLFTASDQKLTALSPTIGATGINDSGQISGLCNDRPAAPELYACVASSNGTITELGEAVPPAFGNPPYECLQAVAINNNGQALAYCSGPGVPESGAVVWTNGAPAVACAFSTDAHPTALNNNGQAVGYVYTSTGGEDGWVCSHGTLTDLGSGFFPAAINDSGVFVGGPLIDRDGTVQNLNTLIPAGSGYQITSATGINDNGQIIANADDIATGQTHALLLTPS